jgi:hypothetical protein
MPRTGLRLDSPAPRRIPTPASVREGRGEDAVRVASNPLTQEANQPVRATPGCALLIFLAQVPGAPEPLFGRVAQAGRTDFQVCCFAGFQTCAVRILSNSTVCRHGCRRYSRFGNLRHAWATGPFGVAEHTMNPELKTISYARER